MHYTTAIHNTAFSVVYAYVATSEDGAKQHYKQICALIPQDDFIPCLVELCRSLFAIMLSYYQLARWHGREDENETDQDLEDNFNRHYIKNKLETGLGRVWHDVQSKVSDYLLKSDLAYYKFEQFVQVLSVVHRLMAVGEEFCGSKSEELQKSIRRQSYNYFKNYHASRLEELRIFLENESWEICPVKARFDVLQLQEFKSLRSALKGFRTRPAQSGVVSPDCSSSNHSQDGSSICGNYFLRHSTAGTPFDSRLDETLIEEDFMASVGV